MEIKKEQVTLWETSWLELLFILRLNESKLDTTQYRTSYHEYPPGSGTMRLKQEPFKSNLPNIISQIEWQLGKEGIADTIVKEHKRVTKLPETISKEELKR